MNQISDFFFFFSIILTGGLVNLLVVISLWPVVSNFLIEEAYQFPNDLVPFGT